MITLATKPIAVPCPPDGYYWIMSYSYYRGKWESSGWQIGHVHNGWVDWIGANPSNEWTDRYIVFADAREIKPPSEETI